MAKDILLDGDNDLKIVNGDLAIGESTSQEIKLLLATKQGEWKNDPLVGANLQQFLKHREGHTAALREAKIQLNRDGFVVNKLSIENSNINIDAERL